MLKYWPSPLKEDGAYCKESVGIYLALLQWLGDYLKVNDDVLFNAQK